MNKADTRGMDMNVKNIKIYAGYGGKQNPSTYLVVINEDCFEMDTNPQPNGINMYIGELGFDVITKESDRLENVPVGLVQNILKRLEVWI